MALCWFSANSDGIMQGVKPIVERMAHVGGGLDYGNVDNTEQRLVKRADGNMSHE